MRIASIALAHTSVAVGLATKATEVIASVSLRKGSTVIGHRNVFPTILSLYFSTLCVRKLFVHLLLLLLLLFLRFVSLFEIFNFHYSDD